MIRKYVNALHLWLGLTSGLLVFIVAITGSCWIFKEEIQALAEDNIYIEQQNNPVLSPTQAANFAREVFPGKALHGVLYDDATEPIEVIFYQPEPEFYSSVFLNPFSGEVLRTEDHMSGLFAFVLDGHLNLWLPEEIGNQLVRWGSVVFAFMLLSGIILWCPRNKNSINQRFALKWKPTTKWRRKNYDMHAVLGFYTSILGFVIVLTGLVMAFPSVGEAIYGGLGGEKGSTFLVPDSSPKKLGLAHNPIDNLLPMLQAQYPQAKDFEIHYPHSDTSAIYVEVSHTDGVFYDSDFLYYDQNTLEEIPSMTLYGKYNEAGIPDKILRMNYDTHIGAILGLPGKILVFFVSLIIASMPITGFLVWYGRRKKSRPKSKSFAKAPQGLGRP